MIQVKDRNASGPLKNYPKGFASNSSVWSLLHVAQSLSSFNSEPAVRQVNQLYRSPERMNKVERENTFSNEVRGKISCFDPFLKVNRDLTLV